VILFCWSKFLNKLAPNKNINAFIYFSFLGYKQTLLVPSTTKKTKQSLLVDEEPKNSFYLMNDLGDRYNTELDH
jgi:hypothetical protein